VQFDTNDLLYVYLDRRRRRRKFLATTLLRVIGYPNDEDILKLFYEIQDLKLKDGISEEDLATKILFKDILDGELIVARAYEPLTQGVVRQLIQLGHKTAKVVTLPQTTCSSPPCAKTPRVTRKRRSRKSTAVCARAIRPPRRTPAPS
jgi:DNA-directed RNA polymerase subunit beta